MEVQRGGLRERQQESEEGKQEPEDGRGGIPPIKI